MITIQADASEFSRQLDEAIAALDRQIDAAYFNWTIRVFYDQVSLYPQWSGDAAANWEYSISSPSGRYEQVANKTGDDGRIDHWRQDQGVFSRGHPLAVGDAMRRAMAGPKPSYTDIVYFSNNAPIAAELEDSPSWVRPINLVSGTVATAQFIADKWRNLPYDATYFTVP